ncbi:hypothetical protein PT974_10033 [Cladobotryum mycophilum]|uniref:PIPK domain-containing protein n=1 Tax=Cladobotryum mycophilum TaxID=491253 RepID=A0ABR0S991_9HYPO
MKVRASRISSSIARAIVRQSHHSGGLAGRLFSIILNFFALFRLALTRYRPDEFQALRQEVWQLDEEEYEASFRASKTRRRAKVRDTELVPIGDLGYSGSTFFTTTNSKYLIKSLPRRFEYDFFIRELREAYFAHMRAHPTSLLVRITDMVFTPHASLGGMLGAAPTHHIVMENLLYGKGLGNEGDEWETYDLKPSDYFFPERDIADGRLVSESVRERLIDTFPGKVRVSADMKRDLISLLEADTQLLADKSAVDYSLFLVRFPSVNNRERQPSHVPFIYSVSHPWRTGVDDVDRNWTYRAVVLDFFWGKSTLRARAMTGLVNAYNVMADRGPMSITADPGEYRERFLSMVDDIVEEA